MSNSIIMNYQDGVCPNPIVEFAPLWVKGKLWTPAFGDRHALLLLKRHTDKKVSFQRAYTGWRHSSQNEEKTFGEGRAFYRWLHKYNLSIDWKTKDFNPHPYFYSQSNLQHDNNDDYAKNLSFVIRPVHVEGRQIKLYVQDEDMLSILNMPYGSEEDFLKLVMQYVAQRFEWQRWKAPAPTFRDWMVSQGKKAIFYPGQLGLQLSQIHL